MKPRSGFAVALLLAGVFPCGAAAHETWLAPSSFAVAAGSAVTLAMTSGMSFPALESAIQPARVVAAGVRLGGAGRPLPDWSADSTALVTTATFAGPGLAAAWVALGPRGIDLTDEQVEEYFEEIGADSSLRAAWAPRRGRTPWHETYTKHAKTFFAVGDARADSSWREPVGLAVELVPLFPPGTARSGDEVAVRLLRGGRPEPGVGVGLMQDPKTRVFRKTGVDGVARFRLATPGPALFFTVLLRPAADGLAWESDFSTLTVSARP